MTSAPVSARPSTSTPVLLDLDVVEARSLLGRPDLAGVTVVLDVLRSVRVGTLVSARPSGLADGVRVSYRSARSNGAVVSVDLGRSTTCWLAGSDDPGAVVEALG